MVRIIKRKFQKHKPNLRSVQMKTLLPLAALPIFDPTVVFDSLNGLAETSADIELTNVSQSIIFAFADRHESHLSLLQAILKRNMYLSPTTQEQAAISSLVSKVQRILDGLIMAPGDFNACVCQYHCSTIRSLIRESIVLQKVNATYQIGSYKKGTMLRGRNIADVMIILKDPPTNEIIQALLTKMQDEMKTILSTEIVAHNEFVTIEVNDNGIDVFNMCARVRVVIANIEWGANAKEMQCHLLDIKHIRWFENEVNHSTMKVLIRILRDATERYDGLKMLSTRIIDILVHFACLRQSKGEVLPIHVAFRRLFQLLAAGIFLPGSPGIVDPCDRTNSNIASSMTLEERDMCCMTAQVSSGMISHK